MNSLEYVYTGIRFLGFELSVHTCVCSEWSRVPSLFRGVYSCFCFSMHSGISLQEKYTWQQAASREGTIHIPVLNTTYNTYVYT